MRTAAAVLALLWLAQASGARPDIPVAWDEAALEKMSMPLAGLGLRPTHAPAEYYRQIPLSRIPRTYPVYAPGREPANYMAWLKEQAPEDAIDFGALTTDADWVKAGELVFNMPFRAAINTAAPAEQWRAELGGSALYPRAAIDGTYPWVRYWVVKKGDVRAFFTACGSCHTRVLDDGTVVPGAQGNLNESHYHATRLQGGRVTLDQWKETRRRQYSMPWLTPDPAEAYQALTLEQAVTVERSVPPGVRSRIGASHTYAPRIPDLIGVRDRQWLDATGLLRHRSIGDLMRYAALVDGGEAMTAFGDFRPNGPLREAKTLTRLGDEALYALARYIYALQPPPNPNTPSDLSRRGEAVFQRSGCARCHPAPLYTSNKLTPADGVTPPRDGDVAADVIPVHVGTDSRLALQSRKGTGYYRVPSLKGVWYRGPFEHNGSVPTLEEWFDSARLSETYVPNGARGVSNVARPVPGHRFGLDLPAEDKRALIAFLRTL
jgi:cytochrome c553